MARGHARYWAGGQLAANVFMRHMYAQQENVLYKHRRSTCMRDRDLCYTYTCISHTLSIHRGGAREARAPLYIFTSVRYAGICVA